MAEKTAISWCDATFNPWWGCAKVSPACDHCYAERDAKRFAAGKVLWGVDADRREFGDQHWQAPRRWDESARKAGRRLRVFCASMADVFDKNAPLGARWRLFELIRQTPNLDWLLLTKRIGNAYTGMLPLDFNAQSYPNVWLGISVVNQTEADRDIPKLLGLNARVRFLSIEPMLGPVNLQDGLGLMASPGDVDWVIAGGESGPHARPMSIQWARSLREQCAAAGVPFHFKQWGEWAPTGSHSAGEPGRFAFGDYEHDPAVFHRVDLYPRQSAKFGARCTLERVGKKAAGRLLDGVEHNGFPRVIG